MVWTESQTANSFPPPLRGCPRWPCPPFGAPRFLSSTPVCDPMPPGRPKAVWLMKTPIKWNSSGSRQVSTAGRPRWKEIRQGLVLALLGNALFVLFALAGLLLVGSRGGAVVSSLGIDFDDAIPLALTLAGAGALIGYGFVLLEIGSGSGMERGHG